jgi:LmbE family N-acetylglucosaminyl deacetylase
MKTLSRRTIIKTMGLTTGASMIGLPLVAQEKVSAPGKLKIVVVGAHPDDPETICGGTMALYASLGHEVVSLYFTRGEAGIKGVSHSEAAKIRTEEALQACKILKVRAEFLGQIDGSTEINAGRYEEMFAFLQKENPDMVFTHWPLDSHRDHRICASLVLDVWFHAAKKFSLYYCEGMTGAQSQNFVPTDYVDITSVIKQKHDACFIHRSQKMEEEYVTSHARMEIFRGMENRCEYAEAFVHLWPSSRGVLP